MLLALYHRNPLIDVSCVWGSRMVLAFTQCLNGKKAAKGTYHPKGFDEEDDLQALLSYAWAKSTDMLTAYSGPLLSPQSGHAQRPQLLSSIVPTRQ